MTLISGSWNISSASMSTEHAGIIVSLKIEKKVIFACHWYICINQLIHDDRSIFAVIAMMRDTMSEIFIFFCRNENNDTGEYHIRPSVNSFSFVYAAKPTKKSRNIEKNEKYDKSPEPVQWTMRICQADKTERGQTLPHTTKQANDNKQHYALLFNWTE